MEISTRKVDDVLIADCVGSLDTQTSGPASEALTRVANEASGKLLVNLAKLDFLSSAGLRVLLRTAKALESNGGAMRVCQPHGVVQEVLDISGFETLVEIHAEESTAVAAFASGGTAS